MLLGHWHSLSNIPDFTNNLKGCTVFSKLDLVKGYHQVPMDPQTAILKPFYRVTTCFCLLGLHLSGKYKQNDPPETPWCIASPPHTEQFCSLNLQKCSIAQELIEYLDHKITPSGIASLHNQTCWCLSTPPHSQDVHGLQRFLGMINFYRRFLPEVAKTLCPLTDALAG